MRQLQLFSPPPRDPKRQLQLFASARAAELRRRLGELLDVEISSLTLTNNRSRIVSARHGPTGLEVRIHRSFVDASDETLEEVARLLAGARGARRRQALAVIREYFESRGPASRPAQRRKPTIEPRGRHHDLRAIRDDLNRRFFGSRLEVEITWGRAPSRRRRRRHGGFSMRLGSYQAEDRLVRIHRALDRADVPRHVVESVVYHEMLHAVIPPVRTRGGRRQIHPPEFRRRERAFPRYEEAEQWLAANLGRLAGVGCT